MKDIVTTSKVNRVLLSFDSVPKYDLILTDDNMKVFLGRLLRSISIKEKEMDMTDVLDVFITEIGAGHHTFAVDVSWERPENGRVGYTISGTINIDSCELEDGTIYGVSPKILILEDYETYSKGVNLDNFVDNLLADEYKRKNPNGIKYIPIESVDKMDKYDLFPDGEDTVIVYGNTTTIVDKNAGSTGLIIDKED